MRNRFLQKSRIYPELPRIVDEGITDLINYYTSSGAYNGGRVAEACKVYEKMIQEDATVCLTLSGALIPTGLGGFINQLMENGLIDLIISTGANLYHDLHFALDLPVHQGDFRVNDDELLHEKVVRIYDIFLPEETLLKTDEFVQRVMKNFPYKEGVSTAVLHNFLGKKLLDESKKPSYSVLATASKYDVPIFNPSPGDSSIGMNLAFLKLIDKKITIDTDLDILESTAIVFNSRKTGAIELGGGAPKNFYMQTQPMLSQIMTMANKGHDYFIQITMDTPHWGGLSGATPSEAVSWKKMKPNGKNNVVVYCDCTVVAPVLFYYVLSKNYKRRLKRLYIKRESYLQKLRDAFGEPVDKILIQSPDVNFLS
jgi:deoxyhypusine synthase